MLKIVLQKVFERGFIHVMSRPLLHIRAVFYSLFSVRNPDHMKNNKFYYIENTNFTTFRWLEYVVKFMFSA